MKEKLLFLPLFPGDLQLELSLLTTQERGAYISLFVAYSYRQEPMPDDDFRLAQVVGLQKKDWLTPSGSIVFNPI